MRTIGGMTSAGYLREAAAQENLTTAQSLSLRGIAGEMEHMDAEIETLRARIEELDAALRRGGE